MTEPNRKPSPRQGHRSQPISRHPLFPAIVALWFTALFGLGSFAIRASLIESLVVAGHVDGLIPAAAPPLGMTARLLLALVLGGFGGIIGLLLGRRMAARHAKPAPSVFKMSDVSGDDGWPGMADPGAPVAPIEKAAAPLAAAAPTLEAEAADLEVPAPLAAAPVVIEQEVLPAPTAADRIASAELDTLSHVELVERLAIAIRRRQQRRAVAAAETEPLAPVVPFPGPSDRQHARAARSGLPPLETEKALREALATLQRMSGTG